MGRVRRVGVGGLMTLEVSTNGNGLGFRIYLSSPSSPRSVFP